MTGDQQLTAIPATTLRSGELTLAVRRWGEPQRPALILVHGYPDSSAVWTPLAQRLAERYYVIAYDVRGAGASGRPARAAGYRLERLVEDLAAVADKMCPQRPFHLVGHDWGSIQGWEAVASERLRGRIASFTSVSGPCLDHVGFWFRRRLARPTPRNLLALGGQLLRSWYVLLFHLPLLAPLAWRLGLARLWPRFLAGLEGVRAAPPCATQAADGRNGVHLYRANVLPRLLRPRQRRTDVPVQLLVPAGDAYVSPRLFDELHESAPRLWRRRLAARHWAQLSHPDALARQVAEFVDFVDSGRETPALRRARVQPQAQAQRGKLVVVTGAGSGIGRETLLDFAARGAEVVAADINRDAAERSAELARLLGARAHPYFVDVGSTEQMQAFAQWVERELGAPDVVVNNAGIGLAGRFMDTGDADWERLLRVNLWSVIQGARLFAAQMIAAGTPGHIVNVASAAAFSPSGTLPAYATTKAAVRMLGDCLRAELAGQGIHVATICPGFVDTGITTATRFVGVGAAEQERRREASKRLYQRRNLKPGAVARAIVQAVERRRAEVPVGIEAHVLRWIYHRLPRLARRLARVDLTP